MRSAAQKEVDHIMGEAFSRAAQVLEREAKKLLRAQSSNYSRFVLAVGWGPTMFDANGKIVREYAMDQHGQTFMQFADDFYDRFGADNRQVTA